MTTFTRYLARQDRRLLKATPIYYGWIVLHAATIGMAMTIPGQTVGLSLFIDGTSLYEEGLALGIPNGEVAEDIL